MKPNVCILASMAPSGKLMMNNKEIVKTQFVRKSRRKQSHSMAAKLCRRGLE
jgi:hypothetical protein